VFTKVRFEDGQWFGCRTKRSDHTSIASGL